MKKLNIFERILDKYSSFANNVLGKRIRITHVFCVDSIQGKLVF